MLRVYGHTHIWVFLKTADLTKEQTVTDLHRRVTYPYSVFSFGLIQQAEKEGKDGRNAGDVV